jgi:general stress protein YciG
MTDIEKKTTKKPRGFAAMDPEKQREIARRGGKIAHLRGNAHEFTPEEAREAGRKGGQSVSKDRKHMAAIGRLGGEARSQSRASSSGGESQPTTEI